MSLFRELDPVQLVYVVISLFFASFVYNELKGIYLSRKWHTKSPVKTYRGLFSLPQLVRLRKAVDSGHFVDYFRDQYIKYGADTLDFTGFGSKIFFTKNPHNVKSLFATNFDDWSIGARKRAFKPFLGVGVFVTDGEVWKHSRTMLKPQFLREQIAHVHSVESHYKLFAQHIRSYRGQEFDIQPLFMKLTMDASSEFLFGESIHLLHDDSIEHEKDTSDIKGKKELAEDLSFLQTYLMFRVMLLDWFWLENSKKFSEAIKRVHAFTSQFVDRVLSLTPEEREANSKDGYTFLYELAKVTNDPIVMRDQILNVMLAGRSTTASLLCSVLLELSRNPEVYEKLKNEVYEQFGNGKTKGEEITFETLKKCTYLRWVLNEGLRMYPPVPLNLRQAVRDTTLPKGGGPDGESPVLVRKGQYVALHIYSMHRLEEFYGKDALSFRPERWADLSKIGWAFMPFGSGPRICLGQQFALTEASYILVRMVQDFPHIASHNKTYPPRTYSRSTMHYIDGIRISLY